jgi:RNA polymerase sigma-70 factor (sigma-E family)
MHEPGAAFSGLGEALGRAYDFWVGGAPLSKDGVPMSGLGDWSMTAGESGGVAGRPVPVTEVLAAGVVTAGSVPSPAAADGDAGCAVGELYALHYQALVRLAALLVRDVGTAEEIVQDSFVAVHASWLRLRDTDKASRYLRQCVVNKSRSVLRHRMVAERHMLRPPPEIPSAEEGAMALLERSAVVAALHGLPARQREALVLRYYADLPEAEIASVMGISQGAVKSHVFRAMAALRGVLG